MKRKTVIGYKPDQMVYECIGRTVCGVRQTWSRGLLELTSVCKMQCLVGNLTGENDFRESGNPVSEKAGEN